MTTYDKLTIKLDITGRDITLEDVMMALDYSEQGRKYDFLIGKNSDGNVFTFSTYFKNYQWILGKPLSEQSESTQKAILKLINQPSK